MTNAETRNAGTTTLLLIQIVIGYEWLVSGLTKLVRGDFPAGLAAQLGDMSKDAPGWYRGFLTSVVLPHADAFGYAIEITELLVGIVLIGRRGRASRRGRDSSCRSRRSLPRSSPQRPRS